MKSVAAAVFAMGVLAGPPASAQLNYDRARHNYWQLMSGQKQLHDLSPVELEEVRRFDAEQRGEKLNGLDTKTECRDRNKTSETPSTLEEAILGLKCSQRPE